MRVLLSAALAAMVAVATMPTAGAATYTIVGGTIVVAADALGIPLAPQNGAPGDIEAPVSGTIEATASAANITFNAGSAVTLGLNLSGSGIPSSRRFWRFRRSCR